MFQVMADGSHEEAIEEMWEEYGPIRDEVGELLSDWQKSLVRGNPKKVRDEVRSFSNRQEQAFRLLTLCFQGLDQFWADTKVTLDEDAVNHLQKVTERYESQLGELFHAVFLQLAYGHRNTITDTTTSIELKNSGTDPVIKFEALSGRVPLFELHESPGHFLDLAETHVSSVNSALELVEQFPDSDIENIQRQLERLESKTAEIAETINSIETDNKGANKTSSSTEETTDRKSE